MSDYQSILYNTTTHGVAEITLNRPEAVNAFHTSLRADLLAALQMAEKDSDIRVVIITGAGRGFSSGTDLNENYLAKYSTITDLLIEEYKPIIMTISHMPKIVIAAVNGPAAGVGGAIAMACDLMIMGEKSFIYQAFAPISLIPDGGSTWQLVQAIGYKRAFELIITGGRLAADKCVEYGLANKVVKDADLLGEARAWAEHLAKGAPLSQTYSKQLLKAAQTSSLEEAFNHEAKVQEICIASNDFKEGVSAFFDKRSPEFTGQ
ncbi:MAG: enoyl-CoA hydratase/isomerase family protein [Emcibacter sp.]|nr:enoyl-CoA hydratase/isomerase family protein [Emcibacter sp.]